MKPKYIFTTLAVGDSYLKNSIESYTNNCDRLSGDFSITTNEKFESNSRIIPNIFKLDKYEGDMGGFSFFLNLKVLSLKFCLDKGYDYIIYTDADWRIKEGLTDDKIYNMFDYMDKNNLDMLFERPAPIGNHKQNLSNCFFTEKLNDYNVFEHTKWDNAHVVNEQILVIKNSWKFRYFVMRWEQFLWYSIHNNIRNYPDGFDIGVSALEAEMRMDFLSFRHLLPQCFEFHDKLGNLHTRF